MNKINLTRKLCFLIVLIFCTVLVSCASSPDSDVTPSDSTEVPPVSSDEETTVALPEETTYLDTEAPVITGVKDIEVVVGGSVSYKDGVSVTDDSGEDISITIDNSNVDLNTVGSYEVFYSAKDSAGNETTVCATVTVIKESAYSKDEMLDVANAIFSEQIKTSEDMSDWDIAYAVYNWTHNNITYSSGNIDFDDSVGEAYKGMTTGKGDCFTYMVVSEVLLKIADIPTTRVERLKYEGEANHFWLLVDLGDGWYHFDSCWHFSGMAYESFMCTDEELATYCAKYNIEYYYRFDKDAYPERGTESYQNR